MKAMVNRTYGPAEVVQAEEVPTPVPAAGEILVKVEAAGVNTADWRLRAAAFPGIMAVPGRMMFGLLRPRNKVLGHEFAGRVVATGAGVTAYRTGDRVFGFAQGGAHAEYLALPETGAVAHLPSTLSAAEGAALPFGGQTALAFLRDFAEVKPGQRVAVIGASGGVGVYAVQIARALGAEVTGVASGDNAALVSDLGAAHFIDYRTADITRGKARFDVILDTVGALGFAGARRILRPGGLFLPLNIGLREIGQALWPRWRGGRRIQLRVSGDSAEGLRALAGMVAKGTLRPVIQARLPLDRIVDAYRLVESRHRSGAVVVEMEAAQPRASAA
jgi:NADPH:quinone reductase-like Zn-dependent oxidoreductase